jgi:putative ABC transport system substrate-binding protein
MKKNSVLIPQRSALRWGVAMKNILSILLIIAVMGGCAMAQAQQSAAKVPRIGFLTASSASDLQNEPRLDAFRQGLRDLGYVEGKNILVEYRYAEGTFERLPEFAEDLVRRKIDILVVQNDRVARAAQKATAIIPIVMASSGNLSGLVASLARPGGNITGLTAYTAELLGKRLELLKEVVPKISRFAFLNNADSGASKAMFKESQGAAKGLRVTFQLVEVKESNPHFEGAFRVMVKERIGALVTSPNPFITFHRKKILELVHQNRIPAMHPDQQWVDIGGLMSYGANTVDQYRRAAVYVDKILKGAKPADLPVEGSTKFELVINLKTAKQLGLTIPSHVLLRADRVIR